MRPPSPEKIALMRKMANSEKLQKLKTLAAKTPLTRWLLSCLLCGKDSEGLIRCQKHAAKYSNIWFRDMPDFLAIFKDQK